MMAKCSFITKFGNVCIAMHNYIMVIERKLCRCSLYRGVNVKIKCNYTCLIYILLLLIFFYIFSWPDS